MVTSYVFRHFGNGNNYNLRPPVFCFEGRKRTMEHAPMAVDPFLWNLNAVEMRGKDENNTVTFTVSEHVNIRL